jgi:hypothetical protein
MKTSFPTTTIELSPEEAIDLYYALKRQIEHTIETHWVNYPDSYDKSEARRLHMLVQLHRSVGHDSDPVKELREFLVKCVAKKQPAITSAS